MNPDPSPKLTFMKNLKTGFVVLNTVRFHAEKKIIQIVILVSIILLSLVNLSFYAPGNLANSPTLTFSNSTGFADNIATDGEGGAIPIGDIDIQVFPINSSGTLINASPLEFHSGADWTGYPAIITYGNANPNYGWKIKSSTGNNFSLMQVKFLDWGNWVSSTYVIEAFDGGVSLGSVSFSSNADGNYITLLNGGGVLSSIFASVDEVRIYHQDGADSYIGLNAIRVTSPAAVLPVTFSDFHVAANNGKVLLDWKTSAEQNVSDFSIQHSVDGVNWKTIAIVAAAGNSTTTSNYHFTHEQPMKGKNYYRILETDNNGKGQFSEMQSIRISNSIALFTVLNNPVSNGLLQLQVTEPIYVRLFDSNGKLLIQQQLTEGLQQIDVSMFNKGMYFISSGETIKRVVIR